LLVWLSTARYATYAIVFAVLGVLMAVGAGGTLWPLCSGFLVFALFFLYLMSMVAYAFAGTY